MHKIKGEFTKKVKNYSNRVIFCHIVARVYENGEVDTKVVGLGILFLKIARICQISETLIHQRGKFCIHLAV